MSEPATVLAGLSDDALVRRCAAGDRVAFEVLARRHQQRMYAICRRVTCHDYDALDALQDALTAAWQRIGDFDGRAQVGTWLYRIATNAAIDEVRRRRRRPAPSDELAAAPALRPPLEESVADRLAIDWAMGQLPPQFRAAVVLREYCGLSYREIAEIRKIPIDTVKSQISRGRQALAELLRLDGAG